MSATQRVPFTELDEAIHLLDTPSEPWTIQLEIRVPGHLDEERLRAAVRIGVASHAMSRARALPARQTDHGLTWEITPSPDLDPLRVVDSLHDALDGIRAELYSLCVPLSESPPLRVCLVRHPEGDIVMVSANHAAFDGFGTLRVLQSISRAYTCDADPGPPVALDEARDIEAHLGTDDPALRARRRRALARKGGDLLVRPARLGAERAAERSGYGLHHCCVPVPPAPGDATVNDMLVAALHMAVDVWNAEHGVRTRRISLLMPVNLRPQAWKTDVVTNYVMETRVFTTPADRRTPQGILDAVMAQTQRIKDGEGAALIELLRYSPKLPLWMKRRLSGALWATGNRLVDTAVISNMGRLDDPPSFGFGEPSELWFSAPARMPCGLSLGAASLGDRLHLAFRYRRALWSPSAADHFAERFIVELDVLTREAS